MDDQYINLTLDNLDSEHLCCALADKKHRCGVEQKKEWLKARIPEGHVFRKLDVSGKVFIEYSPLETAWVPVIGENYLYIYCLWVAGSYKGKGHGKALLQFCIDDAKAQGRSGICVLTSKKKKPFLSDSKFLQKFGFETVDAAGEYELAALSFDGSKPSFTESARRQTIEEKHLTVYYGRQCPYINNCIDEISTYCKEKSIPLRIIPVDSLEEAKNLPCVFNNWAVFMDGQFRTLHLLNGGLLEKLLTVHG